MSGHLASGGRIGVVQRDPVGGGFVGARDGRPDRIEVPDEPAHGAPVDGGSGGLRVVVMISSLSVLSMVPDSVARTSKRSERGKANNDRDGQSVAMNPENRRDVNVRGQPSPRIPSLYRPPRRRCHSRHTHR
jgi:hypothetical protein